MRREFGQVLLLANTVGISGVHHDRAGLRVIEAADAVEQAGLSRAVGTDDGVNRALADGEGYLRERKHSAKAQGEVTHFEERLADGDTTGVEFVLVGAGQHGVIPGLVTVSKVTSMTVAFHYVESNSQIQ